MAVGIARVFTSCWRHTGEGCEVEGVKVGLRVGEKVWGTGGARAGTVELRRPLHQPSGSLCLHHFGQCLFCQVLEALP